MSKSALDHLYDYYCIHSPVFEPYLQQQLFLNGFDVVDFVNPLEEDDKLWSSSYLVDKTDTQLKIDAIRIAFMIFEDMAHSLTNIASGSISVVKIEMHKCINYLVEPEVTECITFQVLYRQEAVSVDV